MPAIALASTGDRAPRIEIETGSGVGVIKGVVRDEGGSPIADATVAIFRASTAKLLKQVSSATDGSFIAKILPGTYTVLAVAQGFNPVTLSGVEVNRSAELTYGFKLERAGSGNTLPEKRLDRNNSKWRIRAAEMQRAIYQHESGKAPIDERLAVAGAPGDGDAEAEGNRRTSQTVVETYFAGTPRGSYQGVNFATLVPVGDDTSFVVAGQLGRGRNAPQSLLADVKFSPVTGHQVRVSGAVSKFAAARAADHDRNLGQLSVQALDEWKVRDGVVLVLGFDYSRFLGAGDDSSLSPRFGLQFDVDPKTRVRAAFTTQTQERTWSQAIDLEGDSVTLSEPVSIEDFYTVAGKPKMNKSQRLEFGVERVLDSRSSVEANAFFDTTFGRGVGVKSFALDAVGSEAFNEFVGQQQGGTRGIRVVYARRLNGPFTASVGYSFGNGQKISAKGIANPADLFESAFFQSFFGQLGMDLKTGTSVRTVFRLSPQATVFAIDPFKGRLAIYDPGLSIFITQTLPNLGLPFHAEAVIDARNLFDFQSGVGSDEGGLRLTAQGRMLRGGILVRF